MNSTIHPANMKTLGHDWMRIGDLDHYSTVQNEKKKWEISRKKNTTNKITQLKIVIWHAKGFKLSDKL